MDPSYLGQPIPTPVANKPRGIMTKRTLFFIIGAVFAIGAAGFMLLASGDNSGQLQQRVSARQATLQKLIADGQKNITNDDLAKINAELNIILLSDNTALQSGLKTAGMKKTDKTITAAEADAATFEKLADAKLNAQYDAAYQAALTQKLESHRALLQELHGKTKSRSLKSALAREYEHLGRYLDTLEKLEL